MKYENRIGKKPCYFEINFPESIEIDTKEDLNLARQICK
jgi:CMP-N-acetylneuraminic acid synthetase